MNDARHSCASAILLAMLVLTMLAGSATAKPDTMEIPEGEGTSIFHPVNRNLFLQNETSIDLIYPLDSGQPPAFGFNRLTNQLLSVDSAPVEHATKFEGNLTVRLFAGLSLDGPTCRLTNPVPGSPADAQTQFTVRILAGGAQVFQNTTNRVTMEFDWTQPEEFITSAWNVNFTLSQGDVITLEIDVEHNCVIDGQLYFDRYETASRIELNGQMLAPELDLKVDQNGAARVEFIPGTVWGDSSIDLTVVEVAGVYNSWAETVHGNWQEEQRLSHFEDPQSTRVGEGNQSVWVWSVNGTLEPGIHMVSICMTMTDIDPNEDCHVVIVHRTMVDGPSEPLAGTGLLLILIPLTTIVWLGTSLRIGLLPWPAYLTMLIMAIALAVPATHLPGIEISETRDEAPAPAFNLLTHGGESIRLNELLAGNEALVLGVFEVDSPNADQQRKDFLDAMDRTEGVAYAQLATGDEVRAVDLDEHSGNVNGSWPILIDESGAAVASMLPSGASDAVLVIDKAGFISHWNPGVLDADGIVSEVESAATGGGRSPLDLLGLLFATGAFIPLIFFALPRKRIEPPETAQIPGAGLFGTIGAGGIGFAIIAVPVALIATTLRGGPWPFVEMVLAIWMVGMAIQMLKSGEVFEIRKVSSFIHEKLPDSYTTWRDIDTFTEDAHIGTWFGWIAWMVQPLLIPQTVAAPIWTGIFGIGVGISMLLLHILIAGLIVLILRSLSSIGGGFSVLLGRLSTGARPRLWGATILVLALWILIYTILGPIVGRFA